MHRGRGAGAKKCKCKCIKCKSKCICNVQMQMLVQMLIPRLAAESRGRGIRWEAGFRLTRIDAP